ncbi:hypothetical protein [Vibrio phage BUCT194]|uniref:Uncharacterized protein n=1 Tax=Vibrio phage BUCT194 TaxID=2859072 RepID=A0AAE8XJ77_9CAUD|nr:hypothetical protein PP741_gp003 [Vibrio phage BUCT194]UAW01110.1 hypothetical protein [Vibrio phage BUCT194]
MTTPYTDYNVGDTVNIVRAYHGTCDLSLDADYKVRALLGNSVWLEEDGIHHIRPTPYIAHKFAKKGGNGGGSIEPDPGPEGPIIPEVLTASGKFGFDMMPSDVQGFPYTNGSPMRKLVNNLTSSQGRGLTLESTSTDIGSVMLWSVGTKGDSYDNPILYYFDKFEIFSKSTKGSGGSAQADEFLRLWNEGAVIYLNEEGTDNTMAFDNTSGFDAKVDYGLLDKYYSKLELFKRTPEGEEPVETEIFKFLDGVMKRSGKIKLIGFSTE